MCDQLLLRVEEAAKRLGIGRSLVYRFIQTGELASVKIAGARRVLVSDLVEFVRQLKEQEEAG
jgi:excisionase family DNA binding protein